MRFQRADMIGLAIAVLGPVGLFFLLLDSYQLWHHHGSPILGMLSANLAIGGGIIGALWRFVQARDTVIGLALALALSIIGVLLLQSSGNDGSTLSTILKLVAIGLFLALNAVVIQQLLWNGLNPILQRRDDRRAAEAAAAEEQA